MKLTIREAMRITPLKKAIVLAGKRNLDREIRNVNIVEVPDTVRWMRGGEILFSSGFAFSGDGQRGVALLATLKSHDISALVLKPGAYMGKVPQEMIEYAENIDFPLLEVPEDMPFNDCVESICALLISEKLIEQSIKPTYYATENGHAVITGQFRNICELLADKLENKVLFLSDTGEVIAEFEPRNQEVKAQEEEQSSDKEKKGTVQRTITHWKEKHRLEEVRMDGQIQGYLAVEEKTEPLSEAQESLLEYTAALAATEMQDEQHYMEQKKRYGSILLNDLVTRNYGEMLVLKNRCEMAEFHTECPYLAFAMTLMANDAAPTDYAKLNRKRAEIYNRLERDATRQKLTVLLTEVQEMTVGILNVHEGEDAEQAGKQFLEEFLQEMKPKGILPVIGISSQNKGAENVADAIEQAQEALKISIRLELEKNMVSLKELGVYRLLAELKDSKAMEEFCEEQLAPILAASNADELLRTLEDYYDNVCNLRKTSENLFLHKNSVKYRLSKISQLLGQDIMDPDVCMNLRLCMKYRHLK